MCFSLAWLWQVCIWIIVICAIVAIIRLLLPIVLAQIGALGSFGTLLVGVVRILLWAAVAIFCVYFVAEVIGCLIGGGGVSLPRLPGR